MARKDNKGRNLHTGESQRNDGIYMYRYMDIRSGKRQTIYAGDLAELRAKEKQLAKDLDDNILIDGSAKKMTVNSLFDYYMATKELADSTRGNYVKMWNGHVKDEIGNRAALDQAAQHLPRSQDMPLSYRHISRRFMQRCHAQDILTARSS